MTAQTTDRQEGGGTERETGAAVEKKVSRLVEPGPMSEGGALEADQTVLTDPQMLG